MYQILVQIFILLSGGDFIHRQTSYQITEGEINSIAQCVIVPFSPTEYNDFANPLVCAVFVAMCPLWVLIARKIPSTREVLYSGWEPVIIAMAISRYRLFTLNTHFHLLSF